MKAAVIGAGPAGLTAAYALSKRGAAVDVYEASDAVGGLARSLQLWGQTVDVGPHRFFSRDRRVNELWLEVVGRDYAMVNRLTRILYKNQFYHYPLQAGEALRNLGFSEATRCVASYLRDRLFPVVQDGSFEAWVRSRFGKRLYEIFFKTYSEKLWGIPCHELDADFAAQRIKQFSLAAAIKSALLPGRQNRHRTLADQFAYPLEGTGTVYSRMEKAVRKQGGRVFLKTPIQRVLMKQGKVLGVELPDGARRAYDQVISSMPLTLLVTRLEEAPKAVLEACGQLTFRNTILVYLEVADSRVCADQWIYIHSPELRVGRITNFRNWSPRLYHDSPNTILALEYWCNEEDDLWRETDDQLVAMAKKEIVASELVKDGSLIRNGKPCRIPRCYPVYRRGYREHLKPVQEYLSGLEGLQAIGRYGSFKYNNQDHSILMGLLAAENILEDAGHDLWAVNAADDTYQEACRITDTGLVPEPEK